MGFLPPKVVTVRWDSTILRSTRIYKHLLDNKIQDKNEINAYLQSLNQPPIINEELFQLNENDIPYFFTTLKNPNLMYFSLPNQISRVDPLHFKNILENAKLSIANLTSPKYIENCFKITCLQIVKQYFLKQNIFEFSGKNFKLSNNKDITTLEIGDISLGMKNTII